MHKPESAGSITTTDSAPNKSIQNGPKEGHLSSGNDERSALLQQAEVGAEDQDIEITFIDDQDEVNEIENVITAPQHKPIKPTSDDTDRNHPPDGNLGLTVENNSFDSIPFPEFLPNALHIEEQESLFPPEAGDSLQQGKGKEQQSRKLAETAGCPPKAYSGHAPSRT